MKYGGWNLYIAAESYLEVYLKYGGRNACLGLETK